MEKPAARFSAYATLPQPGEKSIIGALRFESKLTMAALVVVYFLHTNV